MHSDYAWVRTVEGAGDAGPRTLMHREAVLAYLGDDWADWGNMPPLDRLEAMEVCAPGLLSAPHAETSEATQVLALEGLAESFHVLPYPGALLQQPAALMEAFSIVRATRNGIQQRRMDEAAAMQKRKAGSSGSR